MKISVAIPESSLSDESLKSAKMRKISVIARACAIFGVHTIYVYKEGNGVIADKRSKYSNYKDDGKYKRGLKHSNSKSDAELLVMTLRYLETPQFLRKRLFTQNNYLKFAGVMLPLQIPSHNTTRSLKKGQIREGVIVTVRGRQFIDVGGEHLLQTSGEKGKPGKRVAIIIKETTPNIKYTTINKDDIDVYWGYTVKQRASLQSLLIEWNKSHGQTIITSRKGKSAFAKNRQDTNNTQDSTKSRILRDTSDILVVFGSPERGVHEILGGSTSSMSNARVLNFFPNQRTATVRLDESIMGVLSILNAEIDSKINEQK